MTPDQRATIEAIVSLFETGHLPSPEAYATCTILPDGAGLSYGVHQATARSGSLDAILVEYAQRAGAYAGEISRALAGHRVAETAAWSSLASAPSWVRGVAAALREAGHDSVMRLAQDAVFERLYWVPAEAQARDLGVVSPLALLSLYDLAIHSGPGRLASLRPAFPALPPSRGGSEHAWVCGLLGARRAWLERIRPGTVGRVIELQRLAAEERWELGRPLVVRGVTIG